MRWHWNHSHNWPYSIILRIFFMLKRHAYTWKLLPISWKVIKLLYDFIAIKWKPGRFNCNIFEWKSCQKVIFAMPQYDDSFLFDCEKKRNARSYKPYKAFSISNGNEFTDTHQDNGTNGKWRKKYFTIKRNASASPSPMPVYRSMQTFIDNSTFNCKFLQAPLL